MKENIREYIELKAEAKRIDDRLKELNPSITQFVLEQNPDDKTVEIEGCGVFTINHRKSYNFKGTEVEALEAHIEQVKKELIRSGDVVPEKSEYLKFTPSGNGN